MPYTPTNNPYAVGDPYMYDLKWITSKLKEALALYTPLSADFKELYDYVHDYFSGNDFRELVDEGLRILAADGTLAEIVQPLFDDYKIDIDAEIAAMLSRLSVQDGEINVLKARMDEFSSLPDGSTSGDAELQDIRIASDGSTYPNAGDAVRAQYSQIKSALMPNAYNVNAWENGSISDVTGGNVNSNARIRTKSYIPETVTKLYSTNVNGRFGVYAYNNDDTFIGAWNGSTFVNDGSSIFSAVMDMGSIYNTPAYYNYKYKVVYRISGGSVQIGDTIDIIMETSIPKFSGVIEQSETNKNDITKLNNENISINLSNADNINSALIWEQGGINTATGANFVQQARVRTAHYLPTNTQYFNFGAFGYFRALYLLAYDINNNYIGAYNYNLDAFVTDGSETALSDSDGSISIGRFYEKYPNYRFRLACFARNGGGDLSVNEAENWVITSRFKADVNIKVVQYNIGKFNWGHSGGLSSNVEEKIRNYKEFIATTNPDFIFLQEFTDNIDSLNQYNSKTTLFTPIFKTLSYSERETIIIGQHNIENALFTYLHTTGDYPSWCIYGESDINGLNLAVVSGVLNVDAPEGIDHSQQQIRALTKLTDIVLAKYDNAIIGMDTNCLNQTEADNVRAFMESRGYKSGNWAYLGNKDTYNLASSMYHAIDNVFIKGGGKIVNFSVPNVYSELSSDHFPVIAEIRY